MLKSFLVIVFITASLSVKAKTWTYQQSRYEAKVSHSQNSQTMRIKGSLLSSKEENSEAFLRFLQKRFSPGKNTKLILDVFGGDLAFVNKIYDVVRGICDGKKSRSCLIETEVEMFRTCASACIPLFMVGDIRKAAERSNWGFHQAATLGGYLIIPFMAEYVLRDKGVHPQWLEDHKSMFRTLKMTWLTPHDLHGSDILTHIISHPR